MDTDGGEVEGSAGDANAPEGEPTSQISVVEQKSKKLADLEQWELYPDMESLRQKPSLQEIKLASRDGWSNSLEFLLAAVGSAVGLGNVWRFAFTARENGGGAFVVPYLLVIAFIGTPFYYYELSIGQFCAGNCAVIWDAVPILRGLGYATLVIAVCSMLYYVYLLAIALRYLAACFTDKLPWEKCEKKSYSPANSKIFEDAFNFTCTKDPRGGGMYQYVHANGTLEHQNVSASELYYRVNVLNVEDDLGNGLGAPNIYMVICLFVIWLLVFFNLMFGAKSSGKFAYFTALFPYVVLTILFITAVIQDGAANGIAYLFKPKWEDLGKSEVWFKAVIQAFFSLGVGYGNIITYGSYNPFRQRGLLAAVIVCVADTLSALYAGVTVFASLGSLAYKAGYKTPKEVENVVASGTGLAFQAFPQVVSALPFGASQFIGVCFFLMLISLGLGSGSAYVQAVCSFIFDRFEWINSRERYRIATTGIVTLSSFLVGIIFTTRGGVYMSDFFDVYSSGYIVFVVVMLSLAGIAYIYGFKSFCHDLNFMYGYDSKNVNIVVKIFNKFFLCWGYGCPVVMFGIIIYAFATYDQPKIKSYHFVHDFPPWYHGLGWSLFTCVLLCVPVYAIYTVLTRKSSTFSKKFKASIKPNRRWGPKDPEERVAWVKYKGPLIGLKPFISGKPDAMATAKPSTVTATAEPNAEAGKVAADAVPEDPGT